ncbi:unnamed protein product [Phytomonas sp. Hart1]|nr:unnamed protein product [Phytomonas sp. Hart1]|eukprot:CCW72182.1 unnamed protein product [Phytomonas sp. isolate Hart1]
MEATNSSRSAKPTASVEPDTESAHANTVCVETLNQCEQGHTEMISKFDINAQAYLESTVMDTLNQGLEDLCRVKPANPIDYLAFYLLRRSPSSNVVEVPYNDTKPQVQSTLPQRI